MTFQRFSTVLLLSIFALLAFSGCNSNSNEAEAPDPSEDPDAFGYVIEGTECRKQLHGGCVPTSYRRYKSNAPGLHFMYPSDWIAVAASGERAEFVPQNSPSDQDPTRIYLWRQYAVDSSLEALNQTAVDSGTGSIAIWEDVAWEIYEGTLNEKPVKAEWIKLVADPDNSAINFTFLLVTEPENFEADQAVLSAMVSSIEE